MECEITDPDGLMRSEFHQRANPLKSEVGGEILLNSATQSGDGYWRQRQVVIERGARPR
jgi:hypothetical protein